MKLVCSVMHGLVGIWLHKGAPSSSKVVICVGDTRLMH